ncbi:hypothetical protein D3C84_1131880 [compost metagenome]
MEQILSGFKLETGDKMVEMSAQTGGQWVELGLRLQETLVKAKIGTNGGIPENQLQ